MTSSINEQLKNEVNDFGKKSGGDLFFRFQEGENRVRILTQGEVVGSHYFPETNKTHVCYGVSKGCPFHDENNITGKEQKYPDVSIKYQVYLLDKSDNTIKIADLPYTVIKKIGSLQEDEDYAFDSFPMPYDIKITFRKVDEKGKKVAPAEMYQIVPSPKREEIPAEVSADLKQKLEKYPISENIQRRKDRQIETHKALGIWVSKEVLQAEYDKRTAQINAGKDSMPTIQVDEITEDDLKHVPYPENNLGEPEF